MFILLLFSFFSGLVTIAAPCIWPLLPIILSSSIGGSDHKRPLGITLGILISFGALTLAISYLVSIFRFDPNILRYFAVAVLLILGLAMIIPPITRLVEGLISRFAGKVGSARPVQNPDFLHGFTQHQFGAGFITGLSLGIVWTPCAGPILAAIATLAATRTVNLEIILVTVVYLIGVGIPLFLFAYAGQKFVNKSRTINRYTGTIQKVFGVIMILTALLIFTNYDKVLQAKLLDLVPAYSKFIVDLESNETVQKQLESITNNKKDDMVGKPFNPMPSEGGSNKKFYNANYPAPEVRGIFKWLNLPTGKQVQTLSELRGKVVLIDFWTYTCINCIRTLPHVTSWYEKYKDQGFVVIGVHTPEFEFEKNTNNVLNAIKQYKINYPVAQDNDFATWNAFYNRYWPAKYLIDKDGVVRYTHFGEGEYQETEKIIQELLKEAGRPISQNLSNMPDQTPLVRLTPETYLGSLRMEYSFPHGNITSGTYKNLNLSNDIPINSFTLGGDWNVRDEFSETLQNAVLEQHFYANNVYLVMSTNNGKEGKVSVFLDGKLVNEFNAGLDAQSGTVTVNMDKLYHLIDLRGKNGQHILRLEFSPGVQIFAFTFG